MRAFSFVLAALLLGAPLVTSAQEALTPEQQLFQPDKLVSMYGNQVVPKPDGLTSCFDHYEFGSTPVSISSDLREAVPGAEMIFTGSVKNKNDYAIAHVDIYAKVMRSRGSLKDVNGSDVIDWFPLAKGLSLPAGETVSFTNSWTVPQNAQNGEYSLVTFVVSENRFNFEGLTFTDDIVGARYSFKVVGGASTSVAFDKAAVMAVGYPFGFAAFPPHVDKDQSAEVTAVVKNDTDLAYNGSLEWKLYAWDAVTEDHLLDTKQESVKVHPQGTTTVAYSITDTEHTVYYLIGTLTSAAGAKSIIGVRVVRDGINTPRLNFVGIDPSESGSTAVACVHSMGNAPAANSKVEIVVGRTGFIGGILNLFGPLSSATYEGEIPSDIYALTLPISESDPVVMTATLSQAGTVVDQVSVSSCTSGACSASTGLMTPLILILIALVLILVIFTFIRRMFRRQPPSYTPTPSV